MAKKKPPVPMMTVQSKFGIKREVPKQTSALLKRDDPDKSLVAHASRQVARRAFMFGH